MMFLKGMDFTSYSGAAFSTTLALASSEALQKFLLLLVVFLWGLDFAVGLLEVFDSSLSY